MLKKEIIPKHMHEKGFVEKVAYDHYYERFLNPIPKPKYVGPVIKGIDVGVNRHSDTNPSYPIIELAGEDITETIYDFNGYYVRKYANRNFTDLRPTVFVFHGGFFWMGSLDRLGNIYKRLAELIDGVVVAVDYLMAPEASFPTAASECYDAIKKVIARKEEFNCDPEKIAIMGDSAGGHLALDVSLQDKETKYVKAQVLYYPVCDLSEHSNEVFDVKQFGEVPEFIAEKIWQTGGSATGKMREVYLQNKDADVNDPMISPLFTPDFSVFPRTIMITSEFDFLTPQCEEVARKLDEAGVEVDYYKFMGTFHGFLERLGFFESSDESLQLVAGILKAEL